MKDLYVGDFKPEEDEPPKPTSSGDNIDPTTIFLVVAFFAVLGLLYTQLV